MKNLIIAALLVVSLSSCVSVNTVIPTETAIPSVTSVSLPINTPVPTNDVTEGTSTNLASLSGTVFLSSGYDGKALKPFNFGVKLRQADDIEIKATGDLAQYKFKNIPSGTYELWVLLPHLYVNLSNCFDIELQDGRWKLARVLESNQTSLIVESSYQDALSQARTAIPPSQDTFEFYAVLDNLEIKNGDNEVNVVFYCK